ncbi:hypothetical protein E2P81_ATG02978 [Venturia nashicola]|nr:hypothetical protein E2P81_ATG02978 [Venturia nashicola]
MPPQEDWTQPANFVWSLQAAPSIGLCKLCIPSYTGAYNYFLANALDDWGFQPISSGTLTLLTLHTAFETIILILPESTRMLHGSKNGKFPKPVAMLEFFEDPLHGPSESFVVVVVAQFRCLRVQDAIGQSGVPELIVVVTVKELGIALTAARSSSSR